MAASIAITCVGGPTGPLEFGGVKLLTDSKLDLAGGKQKEATDSAVCISGDSTWYQLPIHFEDWANFSEGRDKIAVAFATARLDQRLRWLERERPIEIGDGAAPKRTN